MDPAIAYYTVNYEPIVNVYQTLVAYNGTSTSTFVPQAATCVPGTPQCTSDYGGSLPGFTGIFNQTGAVFTGANGEPIYWTFVIDPAAHFYDPGNNTAWPVYPSDIAFSFIRTAAATDLPYVAKNPGWIQTQALTPFGNPAWDGAMHFPYNNTPYDLWSSLLVNNSSYCPSTAMNGVMGDGCITFVASGGGEDWPEFLQFVVDNLGASVEPCGWYTEVGAGVPGFTGSGAAHGDGGCLLPGGATSTDQASFKAYMASVAPGKPGQYSYDAFENLSLTSPIFQPVVQSTEVGSGPYWSSVSLATGYGLEASPGYQQPSACGGNPTLFAQYTGYCQPAPGSYIPTVHVAWDSSDAIGLADYQAGTADYADISPSHIAEMLALQAEGKINIVSASSINVFQQGYDYWWNSSVRASDGFSGANNIPGDFFSYIAARALLNMAYPTATIESQVWTSDGLTTLVPVGSQIPPGLGCYAADSVINGCNNPYTVNFPQFRNGGVVDTNVHDVGSAAWWWAEGRNASTPYYDPELAACTPSTPCEFSIEGATGAPSQDAANELWAGSIEDVTSMAVQPNLPDIPALTLLVDCGLAVPDQNACPVYNFGWIADYPDPTDYEAAYGLPSGSYSGGAGLVSQLLTPGTPWDNDTACAAVLGGNAHSGDSMANLTFWANLTNSTVLPNACQGAAEGLYVWSLEQAGPLAAGTTLSSPRVLLYDLGQTIENALAAYSWIGQQNVYTSIASWINTDSVNTNPTIGTGDVQLWYTFTYVKNVTTTAVTFEEKGLAKGTAWNLNINGNTYASVGTTLVVNLVPGTYAYKLSVGDAYKPVQSSGSITVGTAALTVKVSFVNIGSTVYFAESGLAKGMPWYVVVGANNLTGTNLTKVSVRLENGTFTYTVGVPPGYKVSTGATGTFTVVSPKTVVVKLKFEPYNGFSATFTPVGLSPEAWSVSLKLVKGTGPLPAKPGTEKASTNTAISWNDLANGTYTYTAKAKGFATASGTIVINGASVSVNVTFAASGPLSMGPRIPLAPTPSFIASPATRSRASE